MIVRKLAIDLANFTIFAPNLFATRYVLRSFAAGLGNDNAKLYKLAVHPSALSDYFSAYNLLRVAY